MLGGHRRPRPRARGEGGDGTPLELRELEAHKGGRPPVPNPHFIYSKILKPGCHSIRVVSRETNDEDTVQRTVQSKNTTCVNERAKLIVRVSDGNVFSSVTTNYYTPGGSSARYRSGEGLISRRS
jgi:hypothetical protein